MNLTLIQMEEAQKELERIIAVAIRQFYSKTGHYPEVTVDYSEYRTVNGTFRQFPIVGIDVTMRHRGGA